MGQTKRRDRAATLQDVAREAGVSAMTVSASLNGGQSTTRVSEKTRVRVCEAAARLSYRPNGVSRGLLRSRLDTLGVTTLIDSGETNSYFIEVLSGILKAATRYGQNITVFAVHDWAQDQKKILRSCDGRVDGMIFIAPDFASGFIESLAHHTNYVTIHGRGAFFDRWNVTCDNEMGAYLIVRHLIAQGHRRIASFPGALQRIDVQERQAGYRRALTEAGFAYDERLVIPGSYTIASGMQRLTKMLREGGCDPLPTAIFCGSDAIAYGCIEALRDVGLCVPDDISIAGFDDVFLARMTIPRLTTLRQPFHRIAERAVELLLYQIEPERFNFALPPTLGDESVELVVRDSVGPPPEPLIFASRFQSCVKEHG